MTSGDKAMSFDFYQEAPEVENVLHDYVTTLNQLPNGRLNELLCRKPAYISENRLTILDANRALLEASQQIFMPSIAMKKILSAYFVDTLGLQPSDITQIVSDYKKHNQLQKSGSSSRLLNRLAKPRQWGWVKKVKARVSQRRQPKSFYGKFNDAMKTYELFAKAAANDALQNPMTLSWKERLRLVERKKSNLTRMMLVNKKDYPILKANVVEQLDVGYKALEEYINGLSEGRRNDAQHRCFKERNRAASNFVLQSCDAQGRYTKPCINKIAPEPPSREKRGFRLRAK